MSFQDPNAFYEETLVLLDKNEEIPTTITEGQVEDGDLTPFRHKMEAVNTGNQLQNSGVLTLRIPPDGTFVRKEPILVDESAKDDYIIQFQMKQDRDKDGVFEEEGKLFSYFIGQPTIRDDENIGETLQINLIPIEYRTRETLDSERLQLANDKRDPFVSSKGAFNNRLFNYNLIKGVDNTQLLLGNNTLPEAPLLEWRPLAPTATHDLFRAITERQALAGVEGGVFTDFFFDYEASPIVTNTVTVKVEAEGSTDGGVILDPLTFDTSDTQKDNTINVDLIKFKNNVIAQGSPTGGSLPREHTVFSSLWEHGKIRTEWDPTRDYGSGGSGSQTEPNQSEIRIQDEVLGEIRFFKSIDDSGPSAGGAVNPLDAVNRTAKWTEDFVTIPPFSKFASYNEGDIVTQIGIFPNDSIVTFFKARNDIDVNQFNPNLNPSDWEDTGRSFTDGFNHELFDGASPTGLSRAGRTKFFSYSPWTSDFEACRVSCLFGDEDLTEKQAFTDAGYQGVVPDWNYVRAVYDRQVADSRFEIPVGKEVQKKIQSITDIKQGDKHFGNRWYIGNVASGVLIGHQNEVLEYVGKDFEFNHDYRIDDGDNTGDHAPSPELGRKMMLEQLPVAPADDKDAKTYRTHRISRDLQVWFVENRMYRSPNAMPDGPGKSIWGKTQKAWLMRTLRESDAAFKILISPNPMIGPDDARKFDNHTNINGFQYERDEFFAWLTETGIAKQNFYIVCGDRHWQYHSVSPEGLEEFSCGALVDANSRPGRILFVLFQVLNDFLFGWIFVNFLSFFCNS